MSAPGLENEALGAETVTFQAKIGSRTIAIEALADPVALGLDGLKQLVDSPTGFRQLLTERTKNKLMFLFPTGDETVALFKGWLEAAGLSPEGLGVLRAVLDNLPAVEADLHRFYNLDIVDWLRPERALTTRKISVLALDLRRRPESSFGSEMAGIDPLSKLEIMFGEYYGGMSESKKPHRFLTSKGDRIEEVENEARRQRMISRGLSA